MDRRGSGPLWFVIARRRDLRALLGHRRRSPRPTTAATARPRRGRSSRPSGSASAAARLRVTDDARPLVRAGRRPPRRRLPPLLVHQGHRAGGRVPRRRPRPRARDAGARRRLRPGPPRPRPGAGAASRSSGVDISQRFVDLATAGAPPGATFQRADARALDLRRRVRRRHLAVPGRLRAHRRPRRPARRRRRRAGRHGPGPAARRARWPCRPSRPTSSSASSRTSDTFDADAGVNHERTEVRDEAGAVAEVDLWTTCFTPRELRLLAAGRGLRGRAPLVGHPGRLRRPRRPPSTPPSCSSSPAGRDPGEGPGVRCPARIRGACPARIHPVPYSLKAHSLVRRHPDLRAQPRSHRRPHRASAPSPRTAPTPPARSPTTTSAAASRTPSTARSCPSRTASSSRAPWSRSTGTRSCSTSATSPRA